MAYAKLNAASSFTNGQPFDSYNKKINQSIINHNKQYKKHTCQ